MIHHHPFGRVFTAPVGLGHEPVGDDWDANDATYLWFAKPPHSVCRGDHVFALGAGRQSAILGLFEVTTGGPERIPNPWDPDRWPWAIGVRPLAAVAPPAAVRVDGVRAPRATAARVRDSSRQRALYAALSSAGGAR